MFDDDRRRRHRQFSHLRFVLGMVQMGGAVVALVLLVVLGVSTATLVAVLVTTLATTISVLLFGSRSPRPTQKGR